MWKNFWLMVVGVVLGGAIVLLLLVGVAKFFAEKNQEEELVMDDGKLFACKEFREFQILSGIFSDKTMSNGKKVDLATALVGQALLFHRCEFLDPPLFLSDSKVVGDRIFPLENEQKRAEVLFVSVHQKNNNTLFYSLVFRVGEERLDFVFLTLAMLQKSNRSSGEQKDMSETF